MRSAHYQLASVRTTQIHRESVVAAKAIARHQREATLQGRTEEAREMGPWGLGSIGWSLSLPERTDYPTQPKVGGCPETSNPLLASQLL